MATAIPAAIFEALNAGKTVLTANERAARTLRRAFDAHQKSLAKSSWSPPQIFALETWLAGLWFQRIVSGSETRLLLNSVQERSLWREIIAADSEVSGLRSADALAQMAAQAWYLLNRHTGEARLREFNVSTDTRAFARWAEQFERLCARHNYLSAAQLPAALSFRGKIGLSFRSEAEESASRFGSLLLVDFDTLTPAISTLFAGAIDEFRTAVASSSASIFPAPDASSEMHSAARWAATQLAANPAASIAIVVPDLANRRAQLDRVFHAILGPNQYEFSLGRPLAETALVSTALDLLRWPLEPLPLDAISQLLLSPFFGAAHPDQTLAAAEFDAFELRRAALLRPELSLDQMIELVINSRYRSQPLTELRRALYRMRRVAADEHLNQEGPRQSHAGWADAFRNLLETSGLNAAAQSDSLTFQTLRSWESALDALATLDFSGNLVTASSALSTLTRIARETTFAPESSNAPVQILGPLEPGGVAFDALWFLAADDLTWPQSAAPNPMLPWHIQRELGIAGADPHRDAAQALRLTQRLAQSAPQIVFSYAQRDEDGHRRPSPLLRSLNLSPFAEPDIEASELPALETVVDAESIPPLADNIVRGGARVLELQAACAFRAFAEIRLQSIEPDSRELGLDARDRGNQVHKIMQAFWTQVQSQDALKSMPRADRDSLLDVCIANNLGAPFIAHSAMSGSTSESSRWEIAYLDIQRQRLRDLLNPWLDFELTRPAFTVRQQEEKATVQIGPLQLEVRADRIDETAAGPLILDYKTGNAKPSQWASDRPDAPQLPLYAVLAATQNEPLAGVAFALLRAGEGLDLKGFADSPAALEDRTRMNFASLDEQIEDWHRVLTNLAEAFAHTDPVADPKQYPQTCKHCGQRMLCRLNPAALEEVEEEQEHAHD